MADSVEIGCLFVTGAVVDGSVALCFLVLGAVEGEGRIPSSSFCEMRMSDTNAAGGLMGWVVALSQ